MSSMRLRALAAAGAALGLGASHAAAQVQNRSWASAVSGAWTGNNNWSPPGFPNNGGPNTFNAFIEVAGPAYTVDLDQDITINDLTLTSPNATLNLTTFDLSLTNLTQNGSSLIFGGGGTATIQVSGAITLGNATVRGIDTLFSQGTMVLEAPSLITICDTGIDHSGTSCLWQGLGNILMERGSTFRNGVTSTFTITGNQNLFWNDVGAAPTFINEGVLVKNTGAGVTFIDQVTLNNTGTVQVDSGTLRSNTNAQVVGSTLTGGKWVVNTGSTLDLVGAAITTNAGDVTLSGAGSTFAAINGLATNGAAGKFTVSSGRDFTTAGNFTNSGALTAGAGSEFSIQPASVLTNIVAGVLGSGEFNLPGAMRLGDNATVVTAVNTKLVLDGPGDHILRLNGSSALLLNSIPAQGDVSVINGQELDAGGNLDLSGRLGIGAEGDAPGAVRVGSVFFQNQGGVLELNQGLLSANEGLQFNGSVSGSGTMVGNSFLGGRMAPGPASGGVGLLAFQGQGGLTIGPSALVQVDIAGVGPGEFDQFIVASGGVAFPGGRSGVLEIALFGGFQPSLGQSFDVARFGFAEGEFAQYIGLDLGGGLRFQPTYRGDRLSLVVVPAPASLLLVAPMLIGRRRRRASF